MIGKALPEYRLKPPEHFCPETSSGIKLLKVVLWVFGLLATSVPVSSYAQRESSAFLREHLEHSHIALMPEWRPDDVSTFRPLKPSVVAWGNDAVHLTNADAQLKTLAQDYRAIGIKLQACNVWMLTATARVLHEHPEYQAAVCVDVAGERIVPGWLDGKHKGTPAYWGCTSHPLFRKQLEERVRAGIASGANMLHLDDHLGTSAAANHSGGCFCEYCVRGFREWLRMSYTREELARRGIAGIGSFDYRGAVIKAGFATRDAYKQGMWKKTVPFRDDFLAFQRDAAAALVQRLGRRGDGRRAGPGRRQLVQPVAYPARHVT